MQGYYLSDSKSNLSKWPFPAITFNQSDWMLIFASEKYEASEIIDHWETAVKDNDTWKWTNPNAGTSSNWFTSNFDDSGWPSGPGGFGFGDNDDNTTFSASFDNVYSRISFTIPDTSLISAAVLHMDYDDGFVAYLNGQEIARGNITGAINWNSAADDNHEALMYQSQNPEEYRLDKTLLKSTIKNGTNVLAIHVMNVNTSSSDLTSRAFLSFGIKNSSTVFNPTPSWFSLASSNYKHTNFKISEKGETIYLSHNGIIDDSLVIPDKLPLDASYGAATDGSDTKAIFITATPNASNNSQTAYTSGMENAPIVNLNSGFYASAISVTLTTFSPTGVIRYTLDGQTPTATSTLYTGPISMTQSQVLIARCFSTGSKLPSEPITNSYFINENPTNAGILCITTDNVNLYGPSGIYDNYTTDWKKPCYIEYFEPTTHLLAFEQRAALKIDGGAGGSRSQPQRSFRVEPGHGTLGDGPLKYPLQPSRPTRKEYETFYLRNGSNQYLFYPCKDAIETKCMAYNTEIPYSEYTPVQVYLNGQYWGWYELREKQDKDYFKQNYGIDNDSLDLISASYFYGGVLRAVEGKDAVTQFEDNYYNSFMSIPTNSSTFVEQADAFFDIPNYLDYICMQTWIGNTDWPFNNIKIFRGPQTKNRWRYGIIDLEWSLNPNGWTDSYFDHLNFMISYSGSEPHLGIWKRGILNNHFKDNFINRLADLMNTNWLVDSLHKIANSRYDETRPEMPGEFTRWGTSDIAGQMATFDAAHQTMLSELANRSDNVRNHVLSNFNLPKQVTITLNVLPQGAGKIKISTIKPGSYPWTGIYFDGIPVQIEAIANPGYTFANWNSNALLSSLSNKLFNDTLTTSATFTANFIANSLSNQIVISEINYNSSPLRDAEDWIEIWNYSTSKSADISGWYFMDEDNFHKYTFPANTTIGPDGRLVLVNNSVKFAVVYPTVPHLSAFDFNLGNSGDVLRLYDYNDNLVAKINYDDVSPWPIQADGTGKTLELLSTGQSLNNPYNWFAGCPNGSPGAAYTTPCVTDQIEKTTEAIVCSIFPNPTNGKFQLVSTALLKNVSVVNSNGIEVINLNAATDQLDVDLSNFPQGIYLLKIMSQNNQQQTLKVIKN
jgi:hypothetical protein